MTPAGQTVAEESLERTTRLGMGHTSAAVSPAGGTRICERCREPLPAKLRQNAKYCSVRCRRLVAMTMWKERDPEHIRELWRAQQQRRKLTRVRRMFDCLCSECGAAFQSQRRGSHVCSQTCKSRIAHRAPRVAHDDGMLPPNVTTYIEELTYMYAVSCLLCGRRQCEDVRMTREQAGRYALVGLRPCFACRGNIFLEEIDAGQIGSPRLVKYSQTANVAVRWGPSVR